MLGRKPRTIHIDSNNASISAINFVKQSKTDILYQSPTNSIKGVATNGQNGYHWNRHWELGSVSGTIVGG